MKKKFLMVLGISLFSLIIISTVYAFTMGSIDATWGLIDGGGGASNDAWATGPISTSTNYDSPTNTDGDAAKHETVQNLVTFDWNQVRYGSSTFGNGSGFGFLGRSTVGDAPAENVPFLVGQFCHFNNPVSSDDPFGYVPLNIKIENIGCEAPFELQGPEDLSFSYIFNLNETTNTPNRCYDYGSGTCLCRYGIFDYRNRCPYGPDSTNWPADGGTYCYANGDPYPQGAPIGAAGDLNYNGCADRVSITKSTTDKTFDCVDDRDTGDTADDITNTYYLSLLGFIKRPEGGCPANPTGYDFSNNLVYTAEQTDNCYCVYAAVTDSQITPVVIRNLVAIGVVDGISVSWKTVTEVNNLGFNILRAESVGGEQNQINPELIMSELAPGDMFGSDYEYLDETAVEGVTYYYWLVDVPLDSSDTPGVHGPVSAVR